MEISGCTSEKIREEDSGKRSHYWDNVKTVLIFLVVLGHYLLVIQKKTVLVEAVYWWIYSFHMPAFIFVSGYFAKSFAKKRGDGNKLLGYYFNKSEDEKQKQIPGWIRVLGNVFLIAAFMVPVLLLSVRFCLCF